MGSALKPRARRLVVTEMEAKHLAKKVLPDVLKQPCRLCEPLSQPIAVAKTKQAEVHHLGLSALSSIRASKVLRHVVVKPNLKSEI